MKDFAKGVAAVAAAAGVVAAVSCVSPPVSLNKSATADASPLPLGASVGEMCGATMPCRLGLTCDTSTSVCEPSQSSTTGTNCNICSECVMGDYCGPNRTCAPAGMGQGGDTCTSDGDCSSGLRCDLVGLSAECTAQGMKDIGGTCTTSADCFCGLGCLMGQCSPLPPATTGVPPLGLPTWQGATCMDDPAPTKAYFEVPRGTAADGDFYRLPFPNDIRTKGGHPNIASHPTPGPELLGYDVVARYLDFVDTSTDGFSTYPTVLFRFNAGLNFSTIGAKGSLRYVDITTPAGADIGFGFEENTGRGSYICANWVGVRPQQGAPLIPGHTYTVLLGKGVIEDSNNVPVVASSDWTAMISASAPTDSALTAAYAAYAPLRAWAKMQKIDLASTYVGGTVFTTAHDTTLVSKLAQAATAAPLATSSQWMKCGSSTPEPCPQATAGRACPATADPSFDEFHAMIELPIFQKGNEPYLTPTDGGDLLTGAGGLPMQQRTENVCMGLTLPKGTMPAGGWPTVVFMHGTGGSYRSFVDSNVPEILGSVKNASGQTVPMAVLSIDEVEHGTRRGASQASPDDLFFNFGNPAAAHGNPLQGAADTVALMRFAQSFDLAAAKSPTGSEIKFGSVAYWGHSQGSTEGGILLGYVSGYVGAVFSGQGASLIDALVTKQNPVDVSAVLPFVLEETAKVDVYHPVLSILQNAIDSADPLNHAANFTTPPMMVTARHVFQPYGIGDTYAPPPTEQTFAIAAALGVAKQPADVTMPDAIGGLAILPVPAGGNTMVNGMTYTSIVREYMPTSAYDGHFVAFDNAEGEADVANFLADALSGLVPKVGR